MNGNKLLRTKVCLTRGIKKLGGEKKDHKSHSMGTRQSIQQSSAWGQLLLVLLFLLILILILDKSYTVNCKKKLNDNPEAPDILIAYNMSTNTYTGRTLWLLRSCISLEPRCCWPQALSEKCVDAWRGVDRGKVERNTERGVKKEIVCLCVRSLPSWKTHNNILYCSWLCLPQNEVIFHMKVSKNGAVNIFDHTCIFLCVVFGLKADIYVNVDDNSGLNIIHKGDKPV